MTLSELLTDLESKPDVVDINTPIGRETVENVKKYDVPIVRLVQPDLVQGASQPILVIDEGTQDEQAYYNIKKYFNEPVRDQLYTDQQYIDGLEAEFTGWKVLQLAVKIDGDMDILNATASDGTNIIIRNIGVWNEDGSPQWKLFE